MGISQLRSPQRHPANKPVTTFSSLQERAKQYFADTSACDVSQLLEDFCRECDRHVDEGKDKMKDLQEQVRSQSPTNNCALQFTTMTFSLHENFIAFHHEFKFSIRLLSHH